MDEDGDEPNRPLSGEPNIDVIDLGGVGGIVNEPVGVLGDVEEVLSCSRTRFICNYMSSIRLEKEGKSTCVTRFEENLPRSIKACSQWAAASRCDLLDSALVDEVETAA